MPSALRLMAILAHPDDESLGVGGTLAKYAAEGVETFLVTATRGQKGRFRGHRDPPEHPGAERLGEIRERELRAAASVLGVGEVAVLDYQDQALDRTDTHEAIEAIAAQIRRVRPHVVVTFGPDGAYGHPDHIAISQFTTAAIVEAAGAADVPHQVAKLYHIAWSAATWDLYQRAFASVGCTVDGVERRAVPWPAWAITTVVDARPWWPTVWKAVSCHDSQVASYQRLQTLADADHEVLWGHQCFYRVFSAVNSGRHQEADLFEGLRDPTARKP
jgi:LmbE family N-acetylglucosaminyl deacetylase